LDIYSDYLLHRLATTKEKTRNRVFIFYSSEAWLPEEVKLRSQCQRRNLCIMRDVRIEKMKRLKINHQEMEQFLFEMEKKIEQGLKNYSYDGVCHSTIRSTEPESAISTRKFTTGTFKDSDLSSKKLSRDLALNKWKGKKYACQP
jgi:fructose-1,6-bisphosphatase